MTDIIADEVHKPIRKPDRFRHVEVSKVNDIWSVDLVDLKMYKESNEWKETFIYHTVIKPQISIKQRPC